MGGIDKEPINKFYNKHLNYILDQTGGGGDKLEFEDPAELMKARRAFIQSLRNCGKAIIKGGFNPRSRREIQWVQTGR